MVDSEERPLKLSKAERKGLGQAFSILSVLDDRRYPPAALWRGKPCEARNKRNSHPICGKGATTVRNFEAAPGMWVHVLLCHRHGYVWDQADAWGGGVPYRESACRGTCPKGECRGDGDDERKHLWFTEGEVEDLHAGLNHLYDEDSYHFSRCGREGIRDMNTQLRAALRPSTLACSKKK